jgi:hypothetical protein
MKGYTMKRFFISALLLAAMPVLMFAQGKLSGEVFGDYFYNAARDTIFNRTNLPAAAVSGPKSNQGWMLRRINLTYDYDINEQFSTRVRLEADGSNTSEVDGNNKIAFYVKHAFLRWNNVFSGSNLIVGIQPTFGYEVSESYWGFRSVEKTQMDLRGILSSTAFGFALRGKLDDAGTFNYSVMAANRGAGMNPKDNSVASVTGQSDKYNVYSAMLLYKPTKELSVNVYGDFRPQAPVNDPTSTTTPKSTVAHNILTTEAFVGYQVADQFSVGAEMTMMMTGDNYADPAATTTPKPLKGQTALGLSFFGTYYFDPMWGVLVRYDRYDPKTGSDVTEQGDSRGYLIAGLIIKPHKNVTIIPNIQMESYESIPNASYSFDSSVNARLTFQVKF